MKKVDNRQPKNVQPVKSEQTRKLIEEQLLKTRNGMRNLTLWRLGLVTMLRIEDILKLTYSDIYDGNGQPRKETLVTDRKTGKTHTINLLPIKNTLEQYHTFRVEHHINDCNNLFVSSERNRDGSHNRLSYQMVYKMLTQIGKKLKLPFSLGSHTLRKTGAYMLYEHSNHNIALVTKALQHSSTSVTLRYLGINEEQLFTEQNSMTYE